MFPGGGGGTAKSIAGAAGAALSGPLGAIAGPIIGGLFGRSGQNSANEANLAIARENRAWQETMSNTAHQRAAKDLEAAGLNRILGIAQPASTPAGNIATMQNKNKQLGEGISQGITAGIAARKLQQEIKESNSRILVNQTTASKNAANTTLMNTQQIEAAARTAGINTANKIKELDRQIKQMDIENVRNQYEFARWLQTTDHNLVYQILKAAGPLTKDYASAIGTITGAFNLKNLFGPRRPTSTTTQTTKFDRYGVYRGGSTTTRRPN